MEKQDDCLNYPTLGNVAETGNVWRYGNFLSHVTKTMSLDSKMTNPSPFSLETSQTSPAGIAKPPP